jgi:hypothetical protein
MALFSGLAFVFYSDTLFLRKSAGFLFDNANTGHF